MFGWLVFCECFRDTCHEIWNTRYTLFAFHSNFVFRLKNSLTFGANADLCAKCKKQSAECDAKYRAIHFFVFRISRMFSHILQYVYIQPNVLLHFIHSICKWLRITLFTFTLYTNHHESPPIFKICADLYESRQIESAENFDILRLLFNGELPHVVAYRRITRYIWNQLGIFDNLRKTRFRGRMPGPQIISSEKQAQIDANTTIYAMCDKARFSWWFACCVNWVFYIFDDYLWWVVGKTCLEWKTKFFRAAKLRKVPKKY